MSTNMSHPDAYYVIPRDVQHAINDGSIHVVIFAIVVLAAFFLGAHPWTNWNCVILFVEIDFHLECLNVYILTLCILFGCMSSSY